jgi:uncharacterized protein (DUF1697 family)
VSTQVALLRAVNVGGTGKMPMADLRAAAQNAGLKNVRSLLQSGNLVFDAGSRSPGATENLLEAVCAKAFGIQTEVYVRTPAELAAIVARNPFTAEARSAPSYLHVLFMRGVPPASAFAALDAAIKGREVVRSYDRQAFMFFPDGMGTSKLTPAVLTRCLGQAGTARNWNTLLKLVAAASG